ncbi:MAG: hypothetical protein ACC628_22275 [Pirellulaceae bacterium]
MTRSALFSMLLIPMMTPCLKGDDVLDIGSRRELFVDHFLIDKLAGAELKLHSPQSAGVVFHLNKPWEGIVSGYFTIIRDPAIGKYHMYYRGRPATMGADATHAAREVACYAQSDDGIHWHRPNLGLFEVAGTRENNVVLTEPKNVTHNLVPFLDTRPGVPDDRRWKAVGGTGKQGLFGFVSADGVHWKPVKEESLIRKGAFDSQNVVFWSQHENRYLCYFRTFRHGVRWISRATSNDFLNWDEPVDMDFGDAPNEHLYTNQTRPYFRAPHIYIATPARFNPGRWALTPEQEREIDLKNPNNYQHLGGATSDAVFMTSRGGNVYDRTFLESFIRPGSDLHNWVARANYPALGVVPTGPKEMSIYIQRRYGQPSTHIERLTLRIDGFVSVNAPYGGGELVTKPIRFEGRELEVNFSTGAAGGMRVEIQDADGKPIDGYGVDACPEIIGDQIDRVVAWKSGSDVSPLAGRAIRLRFVLKDADLYSIRFR